jgi:hypothetical protein
MKIWAYVFVTTKHPRRVVQSIRDLAGVVKADALFGTPDAIAIVEGDDIGSIFACTLAGIHEAFDYAYKTWLPQSGYQRGGGPDLELYGEEFDPESGRDDMYIYIPIR